MDAYSSARFAVARSKRHPRPLVPLSKVVNDGHEHICKLQSPHEDPWAGHDQAKQLKSLWVAATPVTTVVWSMHNSCSFVHHTPAKSTRNGHRPASIEQNTLHKKTRTRCGLLVPSGSASFLGSQYMKKGLQEEGDCTQRNMQVEGGVGV